MLNQLQKKWEQFYSIQQQWNKHITFNSKRIFMLRSKVWGSCSRLEFKAGVDQDSHETWGRHQAVRIPEHTNSF